ncbi:primase-helicase family protein [Leeuwenhoekiella nanhaiensis]|uniref:Helicase n=1 Tax=Leeuwenhoekiella nanhaiensis TaxID=1655491 RepID=A0A2G1VPV2_9FLAO|nr:primase-helicase family protein [Leeuwenhoekiella nanhaiensis]PHQ28797.1 helicase [Leeuwenhoekiella nanhaiensis]
MKYLRIGTEYYKVVQMPDLNEELSKTIIPWNKQTIIDDHDRDFLKSIKKYEGFINIPSHVDYKQEVKGFYNKYKALNHTIQDGVDETQIPNTISFLHHIFGEQILLGLDYLSILWHYPTQVLPILCLVSTERETGKTTFLNWLKLVFDENMTINKVQDLRSKFNSDWSEKLIIGIEEVMFNSREDSEKIKYLSTAVSFKTEAKGKDKVESHFFGKLVLCSNHETDFVVTDRGEVRYWVRKIPVLKNANPNFIRDLKNEVDGFVSFLNTRSIQHEKSSRMWFTASQLWTEALDKLINGSRQLLEKELIILLQDKFDDFEEEEIKLTYGDLLTELKESNIRITRSDLKRIIEGSWGLSTKNSSYFFYFKLHSPSSKSPWIKQSEARKGRFITFEKEFVNSLLKS